MIFVQLQLLIGLLSLLYGEICRRQLQSDENAPLPGLIRLFRVSCAPMQLSTFSRQLI